MTREMLNPREHVVLIADDDPDVRMLISTTLEREGYNVIEACDGQEAVTMINERTPALALLDVNMPRLDGVQVAERLREEGSEMPFIFVTAQTRRAELDRILATNPNGYMPKPLSLQKLRDQVRAVLVGA
jgi:CheY-like chemotaxis protein